MKMIHMIGLTLLAMILVILAFSALPAGAHQDMAMVYPTHCCAGGATYGDCAPVEGLGKIIRHADGWFIKSSGETIPFDKTEPSGDLRFHRCVKPDNTTRCFFAPESGT